MFSKSEVLAFLFGVLLILVTFGDAHTGTTSAGVTPGNLDSIFGNDLWPVMDAVYPVATIAVFLLFGWAKLGKFRISPTTIFLFASFLAVLALAILDDIAIGLQRQVQLSQSYWTVVSWLYPIYSTIAFFLFGRAHQV